MGGSAYECVSPCHKGSHQGLWLECPSTITQRGSFSLGLTLSTNNFNQFKNPSLVSDPLGCPFKTLQGRYLSSSHCQSLPLGTQTKDKLVSCRIGQKYSYFPSPFCRRRFPHLFFPFTDITFK